MWSTDLKRSARTWLLNVAEKKYSAFDMAGCGVVFAFLAIENFLAAFVAFVAFNVLSGFLDAARSDVSKRDERTPCAEK